MDTPLRERMHALFGMRPSDDALTPPTGDRADAPHPNDPDAPMVREPAVWLVCPACGGEEFTVTLTVAVDVVRPFAHGGRTFVVDDFEAVASVNDSGAGAPVGSRWTCTACGTTSPTADLAATSRFDPMREMWDAAADAEMLVCSRCGGSDLELWRFCVEHVPVVLLSSDDDTPAVVEGPRPLATDVVETVPWCRTCERPVEEHALRKA